MKGEAPFLQNVRTLSEKLDPTTYPFMIPAFSRGIDLTLTSPVTFFVGENGSGKSTLLEAVAEGCGFNPEGGSRDHHRETTGGRSPMLEALRLTWRPKATQGFFLRAESFYNFATLVRLKADTTYEQRAPGLGASVCREVRLKADTPTVEATTMEARR